MDDTPASDAVPAPAPPRTGRRFARVAIAASLAIAIVAVGVLAAGLGWLSTEAGLRFLIARVVAASEGRLVVTDPSGSLATVVRIGRLDWNGPEAQASATEVAIEWRPRALLSSRLSIARLDAKTLTLSIKPSAGATPPPTALALPFAVAIDAVAVETLDWRAGPRGGRITGLAFGYEGDARGHAIRKLALATPEFALTGDATLAATPPFAVAGKLGAAGRGRFAGATLAATLGGTLPALAVAGDAAWRGATARTELALTPFAAAPLAHAHVVAQRVDLAAFDAALPRTDLAATVDATPAGAGSSGTLELRNADPGPVDRGRVPLASLRARFAQDRDRVALDDLDARVDGGATLRGRGEVTLAAGVPPSRWRLDVRELDLARIAASLAATRLSGVLAADVEGNRQRVTGDLAQDDIALAFEATHDGRRIDVTRATARTAGGRLEGSGRLDLDAARGFEAKARAQGFDPSRFGRFPAGTLSGSLTASGHLKPDWAVTANATLDRGSTLAQLALAGALRGSATTTTLADANVDLTLGATHVTASGAAGRVGDRLRYTLDAPRLAELAPLVALVPTLREAVPAPLAGRVKASGTLRLEPGGTGGDVALDAAALRAGTLAAATLAAKGSLAPGGSGTPPLAFDRRALELTASGTGLAAGEEAFPSARIALTGTLAQHHADLAVVARGFDVRASVDGGRVDAQRWAGRLASLVVGGDVKASLARPATLEFGPGRVRVADAQVAIADGRADVAEFLWDHGHVTTSGRFAALPLASLAALAQKELPLRSTLTFAGDWSIAAAPRLAGRFALRREAGDVFGARIDDAAAPELAFGIRRLEVAGTLADDALNAEAHLAADRAGTANVTLALAAVPGTDPGRLARNAPLRLAADADLASLAVLQPWLGTAAAIHGRARVALAGSGTLDRPVLTGTLAGDDLRVDAPRYGIALTDGKLRAHLADGGVAIDELSMAGGDGRFVASGSIAARVPGSDAPRSRIAWRAQNFRVTNRPDLRLVVDGDGALAVQGRALAVAGRVAVVDGRIEYDPAPPGLLSPDVVIVGRPPRTQDGDALADLPLKLDVDVDLGQKLAFAGAGIETTLGGRVHVTTTAAGRLRGDGTIRASQGTYYAFGQKLSIERGALIFDGPLDNPALEIVALRKNLAVEAGVELTGTVRTPRVRITSYPPVPENEALAWLITGQGLSSSSRGDYAALGAASAALLSRDGKPLTAQIAQTLGLDDISVRSGGIGGSTTTGSASGQVIVLGKRITDRLTVGYEQGLSIAANALRIEYTLSRMLTLRAEAGSVSSIGVVYRRSFD